MLNKRIKTFHTGLIPKGEFTSLVNVTGEKDPNTIYKIGDIIKHKNHTFEVVGVSYQNFNHYKGKLKQPDKHINYQLYCYNCKQIIQRSSLELRLDRCPACTNMIIIEGYNDITTKAPWMIDYFQGGYDEAKQYTCNSKHKIKPICPHCHKTSDKYITIERVYNDGYRCKCSDNISFPEKFFLNFLDQLKIDYDYQVGKNILGWDTKDKRYDFYINNNKCIIETHGRQHYEKVGGMYEGQYEKIIANDKLKYDLAKQNGIKNYIVINCMKSEKDWIKNSIMNSMLPILLNFTEDDIDWNECTKIASGNYCKEVCNYYNEHDVLLKDMCNKFHLNSKTIQRYLTIGNDVGWCDYVSSSGTISLPFIINKNDTFLCYCRNIKDFLQKRDIMQLSHINEVSIQKYLKSGKKTQDGFSFIPVTDFKLKRKIICGKV